MGLVHEDAPDAFGHEVILGIEKRRTAAATRAAIVGQQRRVWDLPRPFTVRVLQCPIASARLLVKFVDGTITPFEQLKLVGVHAAHSCSSTTRRPSARRACRVCESCCNS